MSEERVHDGRLTSNANVANVLSKEECIHILEIYKDWDLREGLSTAMNPELAYTFKRRRRLIKMVTEKLENMMNAEMYPLQTVRPEEELFGGPTVTGLGTDHVDTVPIEGRGGTMVVGGDGAVGDDGADNLVDTLRQQAADGADATVERVEPPEYALLEPQDPPDPVL